MKKVLFVATVDSHILAFHLPYLELFKNKGWETHVATNGKEKIPFCDHKHAICMERSPYKLNNLKAIKQMKQLLEKEHFDIIHCHTPMGSVVTRLAAKKARKNGTRVIYTAHGFHFYTGAPLINWLLFYPVEWYLAKYTDTLITINHEDYNRAKKKFSKRCHDIQYVPGVGIDPKKFDFKMTKKEKHELRASLGLKDDDFVMIFPAELSKRKNQIWLIKTLKPLFDECNDMHLLLPGRDNLSGKCQKITNNLDVDKNVHFLGFRNDIPKLLKISDVAVSSAKQEGLPVNIIESMHIGLPIVSINCRGNRDLLKKSSNSYVIDSNNSSDFRSSIKQIKSLKQQKHDYIKQDNKIIEEYYTKIILKKIEKIYWPETDLISIIVPIYNVSSYIERCVKSIIKQTYQKIEILLIDDGSTDESGKKCDAFLKKDNRIKVIHKNNGGLSDARNCGIKYATGKYITFVDSDDYINEDYIATLYSLIKKTDSDISIGIWREVYENGATKKKYKTNFKKELVGDRYTMLRHMLYQKKYDTSACAKLYKKSLFDNIKFPKGKLYEDLDTIYKVFLSAKKISYLNKEIYNYYIRNNGITKSDFKEKDMDLIKVSNDMLSAITKIDNENRLNKALINAAISRYLSANFTILKKINRNKKYVNYHNICINNINKYKRLDIHARVKNNIAVILFTINPRIVGG